MTNTLSAILDTVMMAVHSMDKIIGLISDIADKLQNLVGQTEERHLLRRRGEIAKNTD